MAAERSPFIEVSPKTDVNFDEAAVARSVIINTP
jgi:hypothetical protein